LTRPLHVQRLAALAMTEVNEVPYNPFVVMQVAPQMLPNRFYITQLKTHEGAFITQLEIHTPAGVCVTLWNAGELVPLGEIISDLEISNQAGTPWKGMPNGTR